MKLRIRMSIEIADGQIDPNATPQTLKAAYGPAIARAVAAGLPDGISVDTAVVTRINIATANEPAAAE